MLKILWRNILHAAFKINIRQNNLCMLLMRSHHAYMSVQCRPPYTPLLCSKIGVYRGIHYFLIFALKHRLWVLVRTASMRQF